MIIFNRNIHSDIKYKMALSPGDPSSYSRPDQVNNSYNFYFLLNKVFVAATKPTA